MFHTPDEFLSAIESHPADRTRRLIFADWLDEHGDARGELIRIEEEMRELPVFADRFWELKPRRNELRTQAGREWCGRMRYGTECEPVFRHGIPDGWRERWRLIREFTERWHRVPMDDVGGRQAEIAETEEKLGRKLPPSVSEWIAFVSDTRTTSDFTSDWGITRIQEVPGNAALSLWLLLDHYERFGDTYEAVLYSDLHYSDPRVYSFHSELDEDYNTSFAHEEGKPSAESVTAFAIRLVINHIDRVNGFVAQVEQLADLYRHLNRDFPSHVKFGGCEWDESDNLFVEVKPIPGRRGVFYLFVRASDSIRREQIPEFLWRYARLSDSPSGIFAAR